MNQQAKQANEFIDKNIIIIVAILSLTIIETVALFNGINGALLTLVVAIVAGLAGWTAPQLKFK